MSAIKPVIVIPIYKEISEWKESEYISLKRCLTVLNKYNVVLVGPPRLDWTSITGLIPSNFKYTIKVTTFDSSYFDSIAGYNRLLKSLFFYQSFNHYTHLLVYQLDAYVFKDELMEWCNKGYDYIGAPWFEGFTDNTSTTLVGVGNGGFSLHSIPAAINVLKKINRFGRILERTEKTDLFKKVSQLKWLTRYLLLKWFYKIKDQRYVRKLTVSNEIYEDIFWGKYIPTTFSDFKVAAISDAIKFSFEVNPRYLYSLNNDILPFGCHAWEKYDPEFWSQFIKVDPPKAKEHK